MGGRYNRPPAATEFFDGDPMAKYHLYIDETTTAALTVVGGLILKGKAPLSQGIMEEAWALPPEAIEEYLKPYADEGVLTPFVFTSWNVEGGAS